MRNHVLLNNLIARIDQLVAEQLREIIEHEMVKRLHASWIGLHYLIHCATTSAANLKVKVLNVSWSQVVDDLMRASDVDYCQLFDKIYSAEFGSPGGEPYGILLGDYTINLLRYKHHDGYKEDLTALRMLSDIAAAAFVPFITSVHPNSFAVNQFNELSTRPSLIDLLSQPEYKSWQQFRTSLQARFIALVLPRLLFNSYHETMLQPQRHHYPYQQLLWGSAIYAYGAVLAKSFTQTSWFSYSTGIPHAKTNIAGGVVPALRAPQHSTDRGTTVYKTVTEVMFTESQEQDLHHAGFMPLCNLHHQGQAIFFSDASIQHTHGTLSDLHCLLHYTLCVCRFAHYIKIIGRNLIGQYITAMACQQQLNQWLLDYVASNTDLNPELRTKYPLKQAEVEVFETKGLLGSFSCLIHLNPHLRTTQTTVGVVLSTALN
ncbi:MAG: type VI secretion system contractile sheath large subunit [Pseudomonadota bacterium]